MKYLTHLQKNFNNTLNEVQHSVGFYADHSYQFQSWLRFRLFQIFAPKQLITRTIEESVIRFEKSFVVLKANRNLSDG